MTQIYQVYYNDFLKKYIYRIVSEDEMLLSSCNTYYVITSHIA